MITDKQELLDVLRDAKRLLALPENDFAWSHWSNAQDALGELDGLIGRIEAGEMPERMALAVLFAPTGAIQEVSVSSGWGVEFLNLAARFDEALERAYS